MMRNVAIGCVAIALVAALFLFLLDGGGPPQPPGEAGKAPTAGADPAPEAKPAAPAANPTLEESTGEPAGVAATGAESVKRTPPRQPQAVTVDESQLDVPIEDGPLGGWTPRDLQEAELPVAMDIGDHSIGIGEELEIRVLLQAPALMTLSLLMEYDPEMLTYVANSATSVGGCFIGKPEFYAKDEQRRMILIATALPGAKATHRSPGGAVASFKMRALRDGNTTIRPDREKSFCLNANGDPVADVRISGGTVVIHDR